MRATFLVAHGCQAGYCRYAAIIAGSILILLLGTNGCDLHMQPRPVAEKRSYFWAQLGRLLQSIPQRHMVVLGADLNTRCHPIPGLVGRGVLQQNQSRDAELEALIQ